MAETKRPYDPVKRREYYLRTRELKGRRPAKGAQKPGLTKEQAKKKKDQEWEDFFTETQTLKNRLNKLEKDGKKGSPLYNFLLKSYVTGLKELSKIDEDVDWVDSQRFPEYSSQKLKELRKNLPI